jgi:hypothetical protein
MVTKDGKELYEPVKLETDANPDYYSFNSNVFSSKGEAVYFSNNTLYKIDKTGKTTTYSGAEKSGQLCGFDGTYAYFTMGIYDMSRKTFLDVYTVN